MIPNPYLIAGVALAAALSGWTANGWRLGAEISDIKQQQAEAISVAHARMADMAKRLAAGEAAILEKEAKHREETNSLRAAVSAGTKRLSVKAVCRPSNPASTGMGNAGSAELAAESRQDYYAIRDQIAKTSAMIEALQAYASSVSQ